MHAVDIQSAIESGDANTVVETLKQIETEGNLSIETMIALGQSVSDLGAVDSSTILHFISEYYEKLKLAREESNKPFEIQTKYTGEKLEDHVSKVKEFTTQEYAFLIRTDVTGDEKVSTLINSINQEFGNGDQETKTILIDAVAKTASGDKEDAHTILTEAFGEDKAETIEKKIDVLCDGSVANKDEVTKALEGELKEVPLNVRTKANVDVDASIESLKTSGGTVNYSTEVDTKGLDSAKKSAAEGAKLPLTIEDKASKDIRAIRTQAGKKVSFDVEPNFTGVWHKTLTITKSGSSEHDARGRNYSIPVSPSLSFGSAAQGMNIPKKKQFGGSNVTALVGEEGYEVGYIPSEGRSVIFGANGPEMTSFPSDTVIYPHKQSKEILRRGKGEHKSLGSFKDGKSGGIPTTSGGGGGGGYHSSVSKAVMDAANQVKKKAIEAAVKVGKVSVWWENIARTTEGVQRKADKAFSTFEKYIKEMQATLKTTGTVGQGDAYIANMSKVIGKNQAQLTRASAELNSLDTSKKKTKIKYKQGKKTKSVNIAIGDYITYDAESDSYIIDQARLNSLGKSKKKGGKAAAKAVKEQAEQKINERLTKRNKAEDEIRKAQEALDKFGQELYETFFAWEIELTKIWNITRQIEQTETKISRLKAYQNLLEAELANGRATPEESSEKMLKNFEATIDEERKNIGLNINSLQQQKSNLQDLLNITDDKQTLANVRERLLNPTKYKLNATEIEGYKEYAKELELSIDAQAMAWKYMKDVKQYSDGTIDFTFDEEAFKKAQTEGNINSTLGKAVQDYVKELTEANKSLSSQYETITTQMVDMNDSLKTLQEEWVGYAEELWKISEEEQKKEVDNLKKLSDSLTNTLKNLLDDVKRKLDQRRQQEDNAKTEQDISRKQQRLAALRADTAGGHQVEIAQLQQEITDAQQSYQRSLEDQLLEGLQQQADLAAEQREQQIALQEATIGAINNAAQVDMWMAALSNPDATDEEIKEIKAAIWEGYKSEDYDKAPKLLQEKERKAFDEMIAKMRINQSEQNYVATTLDKLSEQKAILNKQLEAEDASKTALETIKESVAAIQIPQTTDLNSPGSGKETGGTDKLLADQAAKAAAATKTSATNNATQPVAKTFPYGKASETTGTIQKGDNNKKVYAIQWALKELGYYKRKVGVKFGTHTEAAVKKFQKANKINVDGKVGNQTRKKFKAKGYKTGGLATSTGPAWLDGTPSKPELVLNATDTRNFLALRDVLSKAMSSANTVTNSYGGNATYEININVDKIEKDYDVDRVAERVKKIIVKDSGYRNVTQVRNFR